MRRPRGRVPTVVDTNVAVVANRRNQEPISCANAASQALLRIRQAGTLVIDSNDLILAEYRRHLSLRGQPGVGDAFIKWTWDNQARKDLVCRVAITPRGGDPNDFEEFPRSADLIGFDRADRKFVAVALAHPGSPAILNATDRDYWEFASALNEAGVVVKSLCPEILGQRGLGRDLPR